MKRMVFAGAMVVSALGPAGAADAAPSGPATASEMVNALQSEGFHVVLNKVGTGSLDDCVVHSVRTGSDLHPLGLRRAGRGQQHRGDGHGQNGVRRRRVLIRTVDRREAVAVRVMVAAPSFRRPSFPASSRACPR